MDQIWADGEQGYKQMEWPVCGSLDLSGVDLFKK